MYLNKNGKALVLKVTDENGCGYGGFQWPEVGGTVTCDKPLTNACDDVGYYGWLWGEGDYTHTNQTLDDRTWIVVEVAPEDLLALDGKVKFSRGTVIYRGPHKGAVALVLENPEAKGLALLDWPKMQQFARELADVAEEVADKVKEWEAFKASGRPNSDPEGSAILSYLANAANMGRAKVAEIQHRLAREP